MQGDGRALAALPNIGLASLVGRARHLPARDPGVLRASSRPTRATSARGDRRLLRDDADRDRGDPRGDRRRSARRATPLEVEERELAHRRSARSSARPQLARALARGRVRRLGRSSTRRSAASPRACSRSPARSKESGLVGFVDVNDNATARAGMSALMVSAAIERATRHRDDPAPDDARLRRCMGLESMLLGAHAEGVRNVLAITGDPPEVGDYPGSRGVYEIDAIGLTRLITRLNRGEDFNGQPIDAPTVVLRRRRRQPDGRRPRARGRPLPAEARGRRAVRDDADRCSTSTLARPLRASPRRLVADPVARRRSSRSRATGSRCGCTTRCPGSSSRSELQDALARRRRRGRPRSAWRTRASSTPQARERRAGRLRRRAVPAAVGRARPARAVGSAHERSGAAGLHRPLQRRVGPPRCRGDPLDAYRRLGLREPHDGRRQCRKRGNRCCGHGDLLGLSGPVVRDAAAVRPRRPGRPGVDGTRHAPRQDDPLGHRRRADAPRRSSTAGWT